MPTRHLFLKPDAPQATFECPYCGYTWTPQPGRDHLFTLRCRRCRSWPWLAKVSRAWDGICARMKRPR